MTSQKAHQTAPKTMATGSSRTSPERKQKHRGKPAYFNLPTGLLNFLLPLQLQARIC